MTNSYKPRRNKLKSHDSGEDRHNKPVAYLNKVTRQQAEHQRAVSGMGRPKKNGGRRKKTTTKKLLAMLEAFDRTQQREQ